jgi:hypothetical protein
MIPGEIVVDLEQRAVQRFVDWLFDESPIWPDEAPREKLLALYLAHERGEG